MRKLGRYLLVWLYWIIGRGPWLVVGQYHDDEGRLCRFRTGTTDGNGYYTHQFDDLDEANDYCETRNSQAMTDPLGTTYYVWHQLEFNYDIRRH
ncbi:hypothetical protein [Bacteriophage Titan-X]|uniref:Uncharacterized protein n=1 Tax=Bacteriophage Titan-X TaxID=2662140 RepID=A0A5Q2UCF2_9CAUD|nr:hypothetical protein [Bacteriophage Titan-X]